MDMVITHVEWDTDRVAGHSTMVCGYCLGFQRQEYMRFKQVSSFQLLKNKQYPILFIHFPNHVTLRLKSVPSIGWDVSFAFSCGISQQIYCF